MSSYQANDEPVPGYRLIQPLGGGSFGQVWKAEGPGGVLVALKIIRKLNGVHAVREWQSLQNVMNFRHANLVNIYGVWLKDETGRVLTKQEIKAHIPPDAGLDGSSSSSRLGAAVSESARPAGNTTVSPSATPRAAGTLQIDDEPIASADTRTPTDGGSTGPATPTDVAATEEWTVPRAGSAGSAEAGSAARWNRLQGKIPPLELVAAMTLGEGTLMDRFQQCQREGHKAIPRGELLHYMRDAAKGLQYLNEQHVQHCDIKPENLLLVGGSVQVCDYGSALKGIMAAESKGDGPGNFKTSQGQTPQYAAPEQFGKRIKLHPATDQYALAITYYALRTGKYPWSDAAAEPIEVIKWHEKFDLSALRAPKQKDSPEAAVLRRALSREPEDRYASVGEFVAALEDAARREEQAKALRRQRRMRYTTLTLACLLLAGLVAAAIFVRPSKPSDTTVFAGLLLESRLEEAALLANKSPELRQNEKTTSRLAEAFDRQFTIDSHRGAVIKATALLDPVYRPAVIDRLVPHFLSRPPPGVTGDVQRGDYAAALERVRSDPELIALNLGDRLEEEYFETWLERLREDLDRLDASSEPAQIAAVAGRGAALVRAFSDSPERCGQVEGLLRAWCVKQSEAAEVALAAGDERGLIAARGGYQAVVTAAESYGTPLEDVGHDAQLGALAARYLSPHNRPDLYEQARGVGPEGLSDRQQAQRGVLLRATCPAGDGLLREAAFFDVVVGRLSPSWDRLWSDVIDRVFEAAKDPATSEEERDRLYAALEMHAKDRLAILLAFQRLIDAKEPDALREASSKARMLVADAPEQPSDRLAREALLAWCAFLDARAQRPALLAAAASAIARSNSLPPGCELAFLAHATTLIASKVELAEAIESLESSHGQSTAPASIARELELRLRERRLALVAKMDDLSLADYPVIRDDCLRLIGGRDSRLPGDSSSGRWADAVVDALLVETQLAPQLLGERGQLAGSANGLDDAGREAWERIHVPADTAYLQPLSPADLAYVRFIVEVAGPAGASPPRTDSMLGSDEAPADWFERPALRRRLAARVQLDRAGDMPALPGGAKMEAPMQVRFGAYRDALTKADAWAPDDCPEQALLSARLAVCKMYAASEEDRPWQEIREHAEQALDHPQYSEQVTDARLRSHLELALGLSLIHAGGEPASFAKALAGVLRRECNPYGPGGNFDDRALLERIVLPAHQALSRVAENAPPPAAGDLAVLHGSLGVLLERDRQRHLASDHYEYSGNPEKVFETSRDAFRAAYQNEVDDTLKIRWLLGEALAMDQLCELRQARQPDLEAAEEHRQLAKDLESILKRSESLSPDHFAVAALRGLIDYYSVRDLSDFRAAAPTYRAAADHFETALLLLQDAPNANLPWLQSWQATLLESLSIVSLEQSWGLAWSESKLQALQQAVRFARQAADIDPAQRLDPSRAPLALANAYEDYALHLRCIEHFASAQATLEKLAGSSVALTAYQESKLSFYLWRVRFRRLIREEDGVTALTSEQRESWTRQILPALDRCRSQLSALGYETLVREIDFLVGQVRVELLAKADEKPNQLRQAEEIYANLAARARGSRNAQYWLLAADYAHQAGDADAPQRGQRYLDQLAPIENDLRTAAEWLRLTRLRAALLAKGSISADARFELLREQAGQTRRAAGNLDAAEADGLQIGLALLLGEPQREESDATLAARLTALSDFDRASLVRLDDLERGKLSVRRWTAEGNCWFLRAEAAAMAGKNPDYFRFARQARAAFFKAVELAEQLERSTPVLRCDDGQGGPARIVKALDAVPESAVARLGLGRLSWTIANDSDPAYQPRRVADLQRIDSLLEELARSLPDRDRTKAEINVRLRPEIANHLKPPPG